MTAIWTPLILAFSPGRKNLGVMLDGFFALIFVPTKYPCESGVEREDEHGSSKPSEDMNKQTGVGTHL